MTNRPTLFRLPLFARLALPGIFLCLVCLPSSAITLTRCKIDNRFVYSDTDCPDPRAGSAGRRSHKEFSSGTASRRVTVKLPRKQSVGMKVPHKGRASRAGR